MTLHGDNHHDVATSHNSIAYAFSSKGELDKSLEYHYKALSINLDTLGKSHPDIALSYNNMGEVYETKGNYDKALSITWSLWQSGSAH